MARALSNPRRLVASLSDGVAALLSRRYAAAAAAAEGGAKVRAAEGKAAAATVVMERRAESPEAAWVPDPVTGYYRPGNQAEAADAAAMREMLLNRKDRE